MKKSFLHKLTALALSTAMVSAFTVSAYAAEDFDANTPGEVGGYTQADTPATNLDRAINIQKEIKVYNAAGTPVYRPDISYTYIVVPATITNQTVTDETTDHATGQALTVSVQAGITTGLTVNGGSAGSAASATGMLAFNNTQTFTTALAGQVNTFNIPVDFTNVVFTTPGIYRYQITETLTENGRDYNDYGFVDGATNVRYLDVYVDGNLDIYGYVCLAANESVTPSSTIKSNGFVDESTDTYDAQESYYTYDLTITKDIQNDDAHLTHGFPFSIAFTHENNEDIANFAITETVANGGVGITPAAGAATWSGTAALSDGSSITYHGIPCGVDVTFQETNDVPGIIYTVSTVINSGAPVVDNAVTTGSTSTSQTIDSTVGNSISAVQTADVTNTLIQISPTGVVVRYAPYIIMIAAAGTLVVVFGKKRHQEA